MGTEGRVAFCAAAEMVSEIFVKEEGEFLGGGLGEG